MNDYTFTQLTENDVADSYPKIDGSNVVWLSEPERNSAEVFLYDGSQTIQLTNNETEDFAPEISGNNVVWAGDVDNNSDNLEIFLYNGSETIQLTDDVEINNEGPKISGDNVVWAGDRSLFLYNGSETIKLAESVFEDYQGYEISGDSVVWYDSVDSVEQIFLYNGSETIQLTNNNTDSFFPSISGDIVAWLGDDGNDSEVFFYDGSETIQITTNDIRESFPQVSETGLVVWQNERGVFVYDGNETVEIAEDRETFSIAVSGNNVVLISILETVVYNHTTGNTTVLEGAATSSLDISDNNIVFTKGLGSTDEIILATLGNNNDDNPSAESTSTVYRFLNTDIGVHFYTASEAERNNIQENLPNFTFEGASYTGIEPLTGMPAPQPVYRFLNTDTGTHLYTISETEKDAVEDLANFALEGEAFFAYSQQQEGTIPIYRFFNTATGTHFYTPSIEERNVVEETLPDFVSEDVAYYALPAEI